MRIRPGSRVRTGDSLALLRGRTATVVPVPEAGTSGRGVPLIPGEYHPLRPSWRCLRLDSGGYATAPVQCLRLRPRSPGADPDPAGR